MISMLYGALGAILAMALAGGGFLAGWKCRGLTGPRKAKAEAEAARREELERQRAFDSLLGYDVNTAYGLDRLPGGEG